VRPLGLKIIKYYFLTILTLFYSSQVTARFQQSDEIEIDREERLSSENFNDEISYRAPFFWQRLWDSKSLGIQANGGSYNAKRFSYIEEIKLHSSEDRFATFSYHQHRRQTMIVDLPDREMRVRFNSLRPFYISLMVDGDSYKANADFGAAISILPQTNRKLELYAWKVDHLYNDKTEELDSNMSEDNWTYGLKYQWQFSNKFHARITGEQDTPLRWQRQNYVYRYNQLKYKLLFGYGDQYSGWYSEFSWLDKTKTESKLWNLGPQKEMNKKVAVYEWFINFAKLNRSDITLGALIIKRDVDYEVSNPDANVSPEVDPSDPSPDAYRKELGHYLTYYHKLKNHPNHGFQYGYHANHVALTEESDTSYHAEWKFQFAWNYSFDPTSNIFLNTSWDLDELARNYPYQSEEQSFKPWGGGNIQFITVF